MGNLEEIIDREGEREATDAARVDFCLLEHDADLVQGRSWMHPSVTQIGFFKQSLRIMDDAATLKRAEINV